MGSHRLPDLAHLWQGELGLQSKRGRAGPGFQARKGDEDRKGRALGAPRPARRVSAADACLPRRLRPTVSLRRWRAACKRFALKRGAVAALGGRVLQYTSALSVQSRQGSLGKW